MIAALLKEFKKELIIENYPEPSISNTDVLIEVHHCGIDRTDLKLIEGFGYKPNLPFIMGHEISGKVIDIGKDVKNLKIDDSVIVYNFLYCGKCIYCKQRNHQLCNNNAGIVGVKDYFGGYSTHLKLPFKQVIKVDDDVSLKEASCLCDAGLTAKHAIKKSDLKNGETILVFGVGGVGSYILQFASMFDVYILSLDINDKRINSFEYGANDFIQTNQCNLIEAILEKNKNNKFDIFFDIVGNQSSLEIALRTVKANGKIITVGYENDNYIFEPKVIAQNEISIIGSRAGSKDDLQDCVKNINLNELKPVVKHEFKLKEINNAISLLKTKNNAGKIILTNNK